MKRTMLALAAVAALGFGCVALSGCGLVQPPRSAAAQTLAKAGAPQAAAASAGAGAALAAPVNEFGFDLLRALDARPGRRGQTVISPLSVHADLAMVSQDAAGSTLAEMRRVLHLAGSSEASSNAAYADLLGRLDASTDVTIAIANSLWLDNSLPVKPGFVSANQRFFGAEIRTMPLATAAAQKAVNAWASAATHKKIPSILDNVPAANTQLIAVNATYFDGDWAQPFDATYTKPSAFRTPSGTVTVPTMHDTRSCTATYTPLYEAVRLPYRGNTTSLLVVVPSATSSLDALEASMTAESFAAIERSLQPDDAWVSLPRLDLSREAHLPDELEALGMKRAFDPLGADFSRMRSPDPSNPLYVMDVIHKTYLRVDERGTEAAAVTATLAGSAGIPDRIDVDRPFLAAIVDDRTGTILFLAAVRDPRAGQ